MSDQNRLRIRFTDEEMVILRAAARRAKMSLVIFIKEAALKAARQ